MIHTNLIVKIPFRQAVSFYGVSDEFHLSRKRQSINNWLSGDTFLLFYHMAVINIHISIFPKRDADTEDIKIDTVEICILTPFQWLPRARKGLLELMFNCMHLSSKSINLQSYA